MIDIYIIYATDCVDCKRMIKVIKNTIKDNNFNNYSIREINSETDEAIDFAVEHNILDIPACYINGYKTYSKNFDSNGIINTIKKYGKTIS